MRSSRKQCQDSAGFIRWPVFFLAAVVVGQSVRCRLGFIHTIQKLQRECWAMEQVLINLLKWQIVGVFVLCIVRKSSLVLLRHIGSIKLDVFKLVWETVFKIWEQNNIVNAGTKDITLLKTIVWSWYFYHVFPWRFYSHSLVVVI